MPTIAIDDCRKYGKQRRCYVLRPDIEPPRSLLPDGMYLGLDQEGRQAILGHPSSEVWREVVRKDFAAEATVVFLERSSKNGN